MANIYELIYGSRWHRSYPYSSLGIYVVYLINFYITLSKLLLILSLSNIHVQFQQLRMKVLHLGKNIFIDEKLLYC